MLEVNNIYNIDCREGLKLLKDNSIDCCVTSPPYYGLRDYGAKDQIGLEETPEEYVNNLVEVFREVRRVLKDEGTVWLNLGDSYWNKRSSNGLSWDGKLDKRKNYSLRSGGKEHPYLKPKDLIGIPWKVAFALQEDGWYLRSDIVWDKPSCMPESVKDRPTRSHEFIFLLSKSNKYHYDYEAIKEPAVHGDPNPPRGSKGVIDNLNKGRRENKSQGSFKGKNKEKAFRAIVNLRNKRDVWKVAMQPFKGGHFAVFPPKLIEPCVLAGCPKNGIVLDPFMGSGTIGMVALEHQSNFIGFELNPEYIKIAEENRLSEVQLKII